jgi:hypothetical protein
MEQSRVRMVALAWFRPEEWDELRVLCDTYEEWLRAMDGPRILHQRASYGVA